MKKIDNLNKVLAYINIGLGITGILFGGFWVGVLNLLIGGSLLYINHQFQDKKETPRSEKFIEKESVCEFVENLEIAENVKSKNIKKLEDIF